MPWGSGILRRLSLCLITALLFLQVASAWVRPSNTASGLQIVYGAQGVERVTFNGQTLADAGRWPKDQFHIWHMRLLDQAGRELKGKDYVWGENNLGRVWDPATKSWTYSFGWGEIKTTYVQHGDSLDVMVTTKNRAGSGVSFDGATVYPLTLHGSKTGLPPGRSRWSDGVQEPGILSADLGTGQVVMVAPAANKPLWIGLQAGRDGEVAAVVSGTVPDGLKAEGDASRLVNPGETGSLKISLRFAAASRASSSRLTSDAAVGFRTRWPERLKWNDRRLIGTVYLASAGQGDKAHRSGTSSDPRRYLAGADVDIRNATGLERFQAGVLGQADTVVTNLRRMNGQGAITWDIEGQEYPPDTSYVCAPDAIGKAAPEMESAVRIQGSKYLGMKLDDAYFKTIRDAGFRVGVCVRPQRFAIREDGSASQTTLSDAEAATELIRKMKYAHDRWGATLFYADSTVRADGSALGAEVLEAVAAALPDSLLIPEESTVREYRAMAPFQTFLFHGDLGTSAEVREIYPRAFSVNLVNDVDPLKLGAHAKELADSVRRGDILMIHADYWQANDFTVAEIYQQAKRGH